MLPYFCVCQMCLNPLHMQFILIFAVIVVFKVTVDTELENTVPIFPEESQGYVPSSL